MGKECASDLMSIYSFPELMDSPTFKDFLASMNDILENIEGLDFTARGDQSLSYFFHILYQ